MTGDIEEHVLILLEKSFFKNVEKNHILRLCKMDSFNLILQTLENKLPIMIHVALHFANIDMFFQPTIYLLYTYLLFNRYIISHSLVTNM